ncbi:hypothetical protein K4K49_012909 [Colletotrichum sp. SAR 10_70]|nr:hypothetical protein K4K50_006844 [Colletotrichum sp. SAR 10_71]KAI8166782.1 hypothetical protein KHU50_006667 [Colletotrichum sp. SAR 10_65]KAI8187730.1 hypothetical protein K4K51_008100 [Colletotrichum sp. SAR 10_75]KAI8188051.1 hypothetical protein K4K49_012909 [Colletotrichum sp. SAR 10_70]KAI8208526.1 hypothetical protein K4K52_001245 [Colletotrichum sp. SAR 10_76]KAI8248062.1 hypothetical protein K4K53_001140 [Colletotrichum sp. SAR 10_77]KAJ4996832.1 hypothetical protein K4K48_00778
MARPRKQAASGGRASKKSRKDDDNGSEASDDNEDRECRGTKQPSWVAFETEMFDRVPQKCSEIVATQAPRLTLEDIDRLLPETLPDTDYDQDWSRDDEAKLVKDWEEEPLRDALLDYKDKATDTVFRMCLRFYHMSPFELISEKYSLVYEGNTGRGTPPARWASGFADSLKRILVHPLWNGDANLLVMGIQYACILHTEDRRAWKFARPSSIHPFFTVFRQVLAEWKGQKKPLEDHHEEVRKRLEAQSIENTVYSAFLQSLEETVPIAEKLPGKKNATVVDDKPYSVSLRTFNHVRYALDQINYMGAPYFLPADVTVRYVLGAAPDNNPPKADLKRYMSRSLLALRRYNAKRENRVKRLGQEQDEGVDPQDATTGALDNEKDATIVAQRQEIDRLKSLIDEKDELLRRLSNTGSPDLSGYDNSFNMDSDDPDVVTDAQSSLPTSEELDAAIHGWRPFDVSSQY